MFFPLSLRVVSVSVHRVTGHIALRLTPPSYSHTTRHHTHAHTWAYILQTNPAASLHSAQTDGNHYLILNSKGNHFISQKANYQSSKYLGNEMNWRPPPSTPASCTETLILESWEKENKCVAVGGGDSPVVDLCDTAGRLWKCVLWFQSSLALHRMPCVQQGPGASERRKRLLYVTHSICTMACDREAIRRTSFLVPLV